MNRLPVILSFVLLAGVAGAETVRLSEPVERTDRYEVFGAPLEDKRPGLRLDDVIARQEELDGQAVRVTTRVARVCQKKGCFFIATDGAATARVTFADYGFFVPTDSGGKEVTLVGTFSRGMLEPERAAHYAEDLGEEPPTGATPMVEYRIVATSVLVPRT